MRPWITVLAAVTVSSALLGCGGADVAGPPATTAPATTAPATTSTPSTTVRPSFTGEGSEELCGLARQLDLANAFRGSNTGGGVEAAYERVVSMLDEMAGVAPAEIAPEVAAVHRGWSDLREPLEEAGWNVMRVRPEVFEDPALVELNASSDRLNVYLADVCGLEGVPQPST